MRGEFVDLDGTRLYYYAAGSRGAGVPVVFLHGFATSGHLWSDVVSLMPSGHRLVVVDLLGHGRSDPPRTQSLTLRAHGERVAALMDDLGIREACVVGHGMGGGVAQWLAVESPTRVSHMGLVNSIAFHDWPTRDVRLARATLPLTRRLPPPWLLSMVRSEIERGHADPHRASHAIDKYGRPFASSDGRATLCRHIAALDASETRALALRLNGVVAPTAVIWGEDDPFLPIEFGRRLCSAIPGARLRIVHDARHFTPDDAPLQVSEALAELLVR